MTDSREQRAREMQLDRVLEALLGESENGHQSDMGTAALPEVAELRDMAQRFRAAAQRIPLPEGRQALRRAFLAAAGGHPGPLAAKPISPHRSRWTLAWGAAVVIMGGSLAGVASQWARVSPSGPWYGIRVAFEEAKVVLTPSAVGKAQMLVAATRQRIDEIERMAIAGNTAGLRRAAGVLDNEAGWLRAVLVTLPPSERQRVEQVLETI